MKLVEPDRLKQSADLFGDHAATPYQDALQQYYENGAPANWSNSFISEYASSHPWEDFAETAAFYLDMRATLDTLQAFAPSLLQAPPKDFDTMLKSYLELGIVLNEVNRGLGLTDLVPEVVSKPVAEKLRFVHEVVGG